MGTRGPIPKRSEDRHRRNQPVREIKKAKAASKGRVPAACKDWHPIAKRVWNGAKKSGQSKFYEPSDWAVLYSLCDDLSYYKGQSKRSGQMLASIMSSLASLLLTEGDRRRLQIELEQDESESGGSDVVLMREWQSKLCG